jgi:hypothetical protein
MSRSTRLLFLLALALGVGAGLYVGWVASPVQYTDTDPASLRADYQDDYVRMIAMLYAHDGDLAAAQRRLAPLTAAPGPLIANTVQRRLAAQAPDAELRQLAHLGAALGYVTPEMQRYLAP